MICVVLVMPYEWLAGENNSARQEQSLGIGTFIMPLFGSVLFHRSLCERKNNINFRIVSHSMILWENNLKIFIKSFIIVYREL